MKNICDLEIQFDQISVSAKLKRDAALAYSFEKLEYEFEAYGVEDYLSDYYRPGQTFDQMKAQIQAGTEKEIGFSFPLPFDIGPEQILQLVALLQKDGFYSELYH